MERTRNRFVLELPLHADRYLQDAGRELSPNNLADATALLAIVEPPKGKSVRGVRGLATTVKAIEVEFVRSVRDSQGVTGDSLDRDAGEAQDLVLCAWFPEASENAIECAAALWDSLSSRLPVQYNLRLTVGAHQFAAFSVARTCACDGVYLDESIWTKLSRQRQQELVGLGVKQPDADKFWRKIDLQVCKTLLQEKRRPETVVS